MTWVIGWGQQVNLSAHQHEETRRQIEAHKLFVARLTIRNLDLYTSLMNNVTIYSVNGLVLQAPDYTLGNHEEDPLPKENCVDLCHSSKSGLKFAF